MTTRAVRSTATLLLILPLATVLFGCVLTPGDAPPTASSPSYHDALSICRRQQPGRMNKRVHLPPTHEGVARCLRYYGWLPDGAPIEVSADIDHEFEALSQTRG